MFRVWLEDLIELSGMGCNRLTRTMQHYYAGSIFFHSEGYMIYAHYLDGWDRRNQ